MASLVQPFPAVPLAAPRRCTRLSPPGYRRFCSPASSRPTSSATFALYRNSRDRERESLRSRDRAKMVGRSSKPARAPEARNLTGGFLNRVTPGDRSSARARELKDIGKSIAAVVDDNWNFEGAGGTRRKKSPRSGFIASAANFRK